MKRLPPLIAAALTAAGALSQSTLEAPARPLQRIPIHTAEADQGLEYGLWAAGGTYKASFHDAVTFVPYLGSGYPHNQPWSWTTTSVARGAVELANDTPARWHDDFRFELRSRAFTEAYDVRTDGLEQTFVFEQAPRGRGDLVIRGAVDTLLRADSVRAHHGAVAFYDHNRDIILSYGTGTVLDAAGRSGPVYTSFDDGELSLRVPEAWLANARYPVVVDPLLSTDGSSQSVDIEVSDIAVADSLGRLLHGFTIAASASDFDAVGERLVSGLSNRTVVYSDLTSAWSTRRVQCATAGDPQYFGMTVDRDFGSSYRIRVHLRAASVVSFSTSLTFLTPPASTNHDWRADVGGVDVSSSPFTSTGNKFMLVWQRDSGSSPSNTAISSIWGRTLDTSGNLGPEKVIAAGLFNPPDYERPSVTQQSVRTGTILNNRTTWAVAYQHSPNASSHWDISVSHVNDVIGDPSPRGITIGTANDQLLAPQIAGRLGRYLVAYARSAFVQVPFKSSLSRGHGIRTTRIDWPVGGSASLPHATSQIASSANRSWEIGGAAFDTESRSHWAITYSDTRSGSGSGRTWCDRLGYRGRSVENIRVYSPIFLLGDSIAGGCTYAASVEDFFATWGGNPPNGGTAWIGRITQPGMGLMLASGTSCSPGSIDWRSTTRIGSEFCGVELDGAPAGQLAWLLISLQQVDQGLATLGFPGCRLLVDNQAPAFVGLDVQVTGSSGSAFSPLPLPEGLNDVDAFFQWFHLSGPPASPTLQSTQRLLAQFRR